MVPTRSCLWSPSDPQKGPGTALSRPLVNFEAAVLRLAAERFGRRLTEAEVRRIHNDISAKSRVLSHTPEHPPYAAMIRTALLELNEAGGSSEKSISKFIVEEFPDLPWAHSAFLNHHLRKLCDSEEILVNSENCYLLVDENAPNPASVERGVPKIKLRGRRGRPRKRDEADIQNKAKEKMGASGLEIAVREQNGVIKEHNQQIFERDEPKMKLKGRRGRPPKRDEADKQNKAKEKMGASGLVIAVRDEQNGVIKEHNQQIEEWGGTAKVLKKLVLEDDKSEAVDGDAQDHKAMRIKLRLSKNGTRTETISEFPPLVAVDEDQHVLDCSGPGNSSGPLLNRVKNVKKYGGGRLQAETASTTDLILAVSNSHPQERVKYRGPGRPWKLQNQQSPKRRGRPRKVVSETEGQ